MRSRTWGGMARRWLRFALAWAVVLGALGLGGFGPAPALDGFQPREASALDQTITTCDWATFNATLNAVHADGGGTIVFDCSGTIMFASQKVITTDVKIIGNGGVAFDGDNQSTRLFRVNNGTSLELVALTLQDGGAGSDDGGAILNNGTLTITASTFSANAADIEAGAILNFIPFSGTLTITGSIVVHNTASTRGPNCYGSAPTSGGSNLSNGNWCGFSAASGDTISNDILLAALADNGGPTQTMLPRTGSAAIDNAVCADTTATDQRGVERPDENCDIGAVELGAVPLQIITANGVDGQESSTLPVYAVASGPAGVTFASRFDCDNDDGYETPGSSASVGDASASVSVANCTFPDEGSYTVGVEVCDAGNLGDCITDAVNVNVANVAPTVDPLAVNPSPSNEGQSVIASASFSDPGGADMHTCMVNYGDGSGDLAGTVVGNTCTGPEHTYIDGDSSHSVIVQVCDETECGSNTVAHCVNNVAPTIGGITANQSVQQGEPVSVTVDASDPGVNDILSYSFDCDGDGATYEVGPQPGSSTACSLDPARSSVTINVLVEGGDGGEATGSVTVSQTATVCANRYTGALSTPSANGSCPGGSVVLNLPGPAATTLCINPYTGGLTWSSGGACGASFRVHVAPDDGPLAYCRSAFTGQLRYTASGQCGAYERPGVIPGDASRSAGRR